MENVCNIINVFTVTFNLMHHCWIKVFSFKKRVYNDLKYLNSKKKKSNKTYTHRPRKLNQLNLQSRYTVKKSLYCIAPPRLNSLLVFCPQVSLSQHLYMYLHSIHQQWNTYSRIPDGLILLWRRDTMGDNLYTLMITQHCMCIFGFLRCSNTRTEDITGTKRQTQGCWIILRAEVHSLFRESSPWLRQTQMNVHWHTFFKKTINACDYVSALK